MRYTAGSDLTHSLLIVARRHYKTKNGKQKGTVLTIQQSVNRKILHLINIKFINLVCRSIRHNCRRNKFRINIKMR